MESLPTSRKSTSAVIEAPLTLLQQAEAVAAANSEFQTKLPTPPTGPGTLSESQTNLPTPPASPGPLSKSEFFSHQDRRRPSDGHSQVHQKYGEVATLVSYEAIAYSQKIEPVDTSAKE